ncbi:sugar phosphate isomerase/epimerase family protein [Cerasicoccus maritimus]|uniref:sugar phosphate isomerase/epimerase family protein n=1 Tax=Cerasicoccus maritimus TaxID=490089 RepID=UPI002852D196|nr:TIM barrel protein [Cerasicoccus maritimus]
MDLIFTKSKWEMWDDPLEEFLQRAVADGFDAVEIFLPAQPESASEIAQRVADHGLLLVAQIITEGDTPAEHIAVMRDRFAFAVETKPLLVNSHTGSDVFSFEENCEIFRVACELAESAGILFTHETHRGRLTSSGPQTKRLLEAIPELRLNADFSHWFCVHESDLSNQGENVELAIQRSSHIHARVGFSEGPQVPDPLAPEYSEWTELHLALWRRIIKARQSAGAEFLTITPEFGPPPYMPVEPFSGRPLADAWEVNVRFNAYLKSALKTNENLVGTFA